jgi:hypothetical protein
MSLLSIILMCILALYIGGIALSLIGQNREEDKEDGNT